MELSVVGYKCSCILTNGKSVLVFAHLQWSNKCRTIFNMVTKRTQHVAPYNVGICCVDMLRSSGRGLKILGQDSKNVGICCVELLRSFGRGLSQHGLHGFTVKNIEGESTEANDLSHSIL